MAVSTPCGICGGRYDGTPSGAKKHAATAKHIGAATALKIKDAAKAPKLSSAALIEAGRALPGDPALSETGVQSPVVYRLRTLVAEKQDALRRRQASLKWVLNNNPTDATRYAEAKVDPLLEEIETLTLALDALAVGE